MIIGGDLLTTDVWLPPARLTCWLLCVLQIGSLYIEEWVPLPGRSGLHVPWILDLHALKISFQCLEDSV